MENMENMENKTTLKVIGLLFVVFTAAFLITEFILKGVDGDAAVVASNIIAVTGLGALGVIFLIIAGAFGLYAKEERAKTESSKAGLAFFWVVMAIPVGMAMWGVISLVTGAELGKGRATLNLLTFVFLGWLWLKTLSPFITRLVLRFMPQIYAGMKVSLVVTGLVLFFGYFTTLSGEEVHNSLKWHEMKGVPMGIDHRVYREDYSGLSRIERGGGSYVRLHWIENGTARNAERGIGQNDTIVYLGGYPVMRFSLKGLEKGVFFVDCSYSYKNRRSRYGDERQVWKKGNQVKLIPAKGEGGPNSHSYLLSGLMNQLSWFRTAVHGKPYFFYPLSNPEHERKLEEAREKKEREKRDKETAKAAKKAEQEATRQDRIRQDSIWAQKLLVPEE